MHSQRSCDHAGPCAENGTAWLPPREAVYHQERAMANVDLVTHPVAVALAFEVEAVEDIAAGHANRVVLAQDEIDAAV